MIRKPDFWMGLSRARLDVEDAGEMKRSMVNERVTKISEESEPMVCDQVAKENIV